MVISSTRGEISIAVIRGWHGLRRDRPVERSCVSTPVRRHRAGWLNLFWLRFPVLWINTLPMANTLWNSCYRIPFFQDIPTPDEILPG